MPRKYNLQDIEEQLEPFFEKRDLADSTKKAYISHLKQYCNFIGQSIPEFIEEANQEQIPYINQKNQIIIPNPENTKLKEKLDRFQKEESERINPSTVEKAVTFVRAVYSTLGNSLKMPRRKKLKIPSTNKERLTHDKLQQIIIDSPLKYKFLITFMASTGMRIGDATEITIQDWLNSMDETSLETALSKKEDIIGYFEFFPAKTRNDNILCQTFSSPEANRYIQEYLTERIRNGEKLKLTDKLFKTNSKTPVQIAEDFFYRKSIKFYNKELKILNKKLEDNEISIKEHDTLKGKISRFHPHALRHYFISMTAIYCNNLKVGARFAGHTLPEATDKNYVAFNKEELYSFYLKILPYVTFKEKVKVTEIVPDDLVKLKELEVKYEKEKQTNEENSKRIGRLEELFHEFNSDLFDKI